MYKSLTVRNLKVLIEPKMAFETNQDFIHVQQTEQVGENIIPYIRNLEQIMRFSEDNILPTFSQLVDTDKTCKKVLPEEFANQENIASLINQNSGSNDVIKAKESELKEIGEKETSLKTNIEHVKHKLKKLELIHEKHKQSEIKKKLTTCTNFAKISKKFTGTNFDYQGPNLSGFILVKDKVQSFDLNPSKSNRQNISKHLWELLGATSNENWLDIFDGE